MANNSNLWDLPGQGSRSGVASAGINNSNFIRTPPYGNVSMLNTPLGRVPVVPPVPPRPVQNTYPTNMYNSQGSYFNNYSYGGYPSYMGSSYGIGYRPSFNSYGYGYGASGYYGANNPESRFIQLAEESSRPAFQSIQSVLQAFSSVAMMFDSTFNALYSSYMSVIGVADNFGKLRSVFAQIFSALAIFRTFHWLFRQFLYKLGISKLNPATESDWVDAFNKASGANGDAKQRNQKPWSTMLFLSIIMAGPYFLFKLMSHIYPQPTHEPWDPMRNPGSLAVGLYDFTSSNGDELSFSTNQKLMIAPDQFQSANSSGWVLACNENKRIGLVPSNYIGMIVQSERTGQTYVNRGQGYQPLAPVGESTSKQSENASGEGTSENKAEEGNAEKTTE